MKRNIEKAHNDYMRLATRKNCGKGYVFWLSELDDIVKLANGNPYAAAHYALGVGFITGYRRRQKDEEQK